MLLLSSYSTPSTPSHTHTNTPLTPTPHPPSLTQVGQKIDDLYQDFRDGNKLLLLLELLCNVKLVGREGGSEGGMERMRGERVEG